MKRLFLVFLCFGLLVFGSIGFSKIIEVPDAIAWMPLPLIVSDSPSAGGECISPACPATCVLTETEGFEGGSSACWTAGTAECNNAWLTGAGTPALATSPGTPSEGTGCSQSIRYNASEAQVFSYFDYGDTIARGTYNIDIEFMIYIDEVTSTEYVTGIYIAEPSNATSSGNYLGRLGLYNAGGTYKFKVYASSNSAEVTFVEDTWYTINMHFDTTAANSYFTVDGGGQQTFTRYDNGNARYFLFGPMSNIGAGESADVYICYVSISYSSP